MGTSARARIGAAVAAAAVVAGVLTPLAASPATAAAIPLSSVFPDGGGYTAESTAGGERAFVVTGTEAIAFEERTYQPGEFVGYRVTTMWPVAGPGFPSCTPAASGDVATRRWDFVNSSGQTLARVDPWGFGGSGIVEYEDVLIRTPGRATSPAVGALRVICTHSNGAPTEVRASIPLTVVDRPTSLYASPHQFTLTDLVAGRSAPFAAMGFTPGESVTVSVVDENGEAAVPIVRSVVTADGAGGIRGTLAMPASIGSAQGLSFIAAGATSRYALNTTLSDDFPGTGALSATVVSQAGSPSGKAVRVDIRGYDARASVVVALHSASAPVTLGTLTLDAQGAGTALYPLPAGVGAQHTVWAGEKTGGYWLRSSTLSEISFVDVPASYQFAEPIQWMATSGITTGYDLGDGRREFRPWGNVTRDAMAAFLYRFSGSPTYTPPATSPFVDVPTSNPFYTEVAWLAAQGISTGWDVGSARREFRPYAPITRDAMAAFLYRYAERAGRPAPTSQVSFVDVPAGSGFASEIAWLAGVGVTTGYDVGAGRREFRPFDNITRDAMAAFLFRYANLPRP